MVGEELSGDLLRGRDRFRLWREGRQVGDRIPQTLWNFAVGLARAHGISRTSNVLGLDYYHLKKRVEKSVDEAASLDAAFIELPAPVTKQCLFELDNGAGVIRRLQLMGYDSADVEILARMFWNSK